MVSVTTNIYFQINFISENWRKINNDSAVCFGAKSDAYGNFSIKESGLIVTFKLVHRNGSLKCNPYIPPSYWGCTHAKFEKYQLETILANKNRTVLPLADYSRRAYPCGYRYYSYKLDGIGVNSSELIFNQLSPPMSVAVGQEFQIWFGEDMLDCKEGNNSGQTCVDIYAWYV